MSWPSTPPSGIESVVLDRIIYCLRDDLTTLRQFSLVCSAWLRPTSVHLFRRIRWPKCEHYHRPAHDESCVHLTKCRCSPEPIVFAQLVDDLGKCPRVCLYTQELLLSGQRRLSLPTWNGTREVTKDVDTMFFEVFTQIMALLPALSVLRLVDCRFKSPSSSKFFEYISVIDLKELVFTTTFAPENNCGQNNGDIRDFLKYFGRIDRLIFDRRDSNTFQPLPSITSPSARCPVVSTLEYRCHPTAPPTTSVHVTAIRSNIVLSKLTTLVLDAVPETFGHSLDALLRDALNLASLTYNLRGSFVPTIPPTLRLRRLNVEGIIADWPHDDIHDDDTADWELAMRLLRLTSRPSLESISLSVLHRHWPRLVPNRHNSYPGHRIRVPSCLRQIDWTIMNEICTLCKGLRQVTIFIETQNTTGDGQCQLFSKSPSRITATELLEDQISESIMSMFKLVVT